jgi:hypothetical protein
MPIFSFIRVHLKPSIKRNYYSFLTTRHAKALHNSIFHFYSSSILCWFLYHVSSLTRNTYIFPFLYCCIFIVLVFGIFSKGQKKIASNCKRLDNLPLTSNRSPFLLLPPRILNLSEPIYLLNKYFFFFLVNFCVSKRLCYSMRS